MRIAAKRNRQSMFDGDRKGIQQTSLRSFFAPAINQPAVHGHDNAAALRGTAAMTKKAKRNNNDDDSNNKNNTAVCGTKQKTPPSKTREQMYLDLGQRKQFGTAECQLCGMVYTFGLAEDTDAHAKVCNDYKFGVSFPNRINRCRWTDIVPRLSKIVEVRPTDASPTLRQKVRAACSIAYAELGFSRRDNDDDYDDHGMMSPKLDDKDTPPATRTLARTVYLYVNEQRIVGLCVVERITKAHRLTAHDDGATTRTCQTADAVLGIHLLWIHPDHRRKGIAKSLIDHACTAMVYGYYIPPAQVAFSSPTMAGTQFAQWYCDRWDVLVYDCV